jgi:hypothetical protein
MLTIEYKLLTVEDAVKILEENDGHLDADQRLLVIEPKR